MTIYYAITLGPLIKTLGKARKTRELWAASYLFSYLMKSLIIAFKEKKADFLVPYVDLVTWRGQEHDILKSPNGAGIFADRCVFSIPSENREFDWEKVVKLINQVKTSLFKSSYRFLLDQNPKLFKESPKKACKDMKEFFLDYFQVYAVSINVDESPEAKKLQKKEIVASLFAKLDVLELHTQIFPEEKMDWLEILLGSVSLMHRNVNSFLVKDALGNDRFAKNRFESLVEISSRDLIEQLEEEPSNAFRTLIESDDASVSLPDSSEEISDPLIYLERSFPREFKTYHKYIAIVQADGDGIGNCIKALDDQMYGVFSKALLSFSLQAADKVREYGGVPAFVGGDDILFFAPLRYGKKDLFSLIDSLDELFSKELSGLPLTEFPTLSYGVSVGYHKFPMYENLEITRGQLFGKAKHFEFRNGMKNAVAIQIQKHSGQTFSAIFRKEARLDAESQGIDSYSVFKKLVRLNIEENSFLNSVIYHLGRDWPLLEEVGMDDTSLEHLLNKNFNESFHQKQEIQVFIEGFRALIQGVFQDYQEGDRKENLYGAIRLVKFLNRDDND
ncbi:MAG: hypothetical protein JJU34_12035 [Lunatimonas sp.]|uniref:Cas10/Cmr2 second palm domain-containing protein n=1 Tax=Lunatimonas sp. TaxID=2060141 RepID=UPI00263B086B|nr:type III-B CRISPR-associated protein Cas10/Cmr2 [Lunatimonas sp.]MCC5938001.1 hypothetical protein [Lunatimonas sp.]